MDWDGRGRLLVKVGPCPSYSLSNLYKVPLVLWETLCGRRRISFSSQSTPPEQGTGLSVCEKLMSLFWVLLVGSRGSPLYCADLTMDVSPLEDWHQGGFAGQFPGCSETLDQGVFPGRSLWGAREEPDWSTHLRPCILPYSIWRRLQGHHPYSLLSTELMHVWAMSSAWIL